MCMHPSKVSSFLPIATFRLHVLVFVLILAPHACHRLRLRPRPPPCYYYQSSLDDSLSLTQQPQQSPQTAAGTDEEFGVMTSSPEKRRKSFRSPLRKRNDVGLHRTAESSYDPFVSPSRPARDVEGPAGVLKESLIAQLNARVRSAPQESFDFQTVQTKQSESPSLAAGPGGFQFSYDSKHKRLFDSMKSIGGTPRSRPTSSTVKTSERRSQTAAAPEQRGLPPKRSRSPTQCLATPSKRRKVEMASPEKSAAATSKLSFNFSKESNKPASPTKLPVPASIRAQPNFNAIKACRTAPPSTESGLDDNVFGKMGAMHQSPTKVESKTAFQSLFPSTAHLASPIPKPSGIARNQKRKETQKKVCLDRKLTKNSTPAKPGWR